MTITEVLVSLTIVGVLFALSLVGIQASREAGRRTVCEAHLHQIGIAVAAYESAHKILPPGLSDASLHVAILPFMEQSALYDRLSALHSNGVFDPPADLPTIPVYLCPSDGAIVYGNGRAGTNYAGNCGTWWPSHGWDGVFVYWRKISLDDEVSPIRLSSITDGMSNTIALSELLRGSGNKERLRVIWKLPIGTSDIDTLANQCRSIPPDPAQYGWLGASNMRGRPWTDGNIGFTLNNHVLPPNQPSCKFTMYSGAYSAASSHPVGVNVLLADGHVKFFSNHVDIKLWRSLASRAGGETN